MKNSLPPEHIEPTDLWLALTAIPRPHRLVDVPRFVPGTKTPVGQVVMWPLTQEEQMACNAEAERFTRVLLKDPTKRDQANLGYEHTYGNESAIQILWRSCRHAQNLERPAFPSPSLMRSTFTSDEVSSLFESYLTVQAELGPIVADMTPEMAEAWIERLAEGGSALPLALLSSAAMNTLAVFMAKLIVSYRTERSSAGSPPDEPPTESENEPNLHPFAEVELDHALAIDTE